MREMLGFTSILGFIVAFLVFMVMDPAFQLVYICIIFLVNLFIVSFYGLTLFDEKKMERSNKLPTLTIIVPSYNSEKTIEKCLRHVLAMKYPHVHEVVLVDDGSTDRTREIASQFPVRIMHRKQNKGKAASLNEAIKQAKGELVACVDSDTYPPENLLMDSVPYITPGMGAMTFYITVEKPRTIWQRMQQMEYFFSFGAFPYLGAKFNAVLVTPGPLTIFKRSALEKIGGFDENNITEDFEMGLKLHKSHYQIGYLPINVPTEVPPHFSGLMRQRIRWYRGTMFNLALYKELLFNDKYADVGTFSFPVTATYVPITIVSFFFVLARGVRFVYESGLQAAQFAMYGQMPSLAFDPLYIRADALMFLSFLLTYVFFLWISLSLIKEKIGWDKLPGLLMVIFVYPFVNAGFYVYSLYKEMRGSDLQW